MKLYTLLAASAVLAISGSAFAAPLTGTNKQLAQARSTSQEAGSQSDISPTAAALTANADSADITVSGTITFDDTGDLYGFTSLSMKLSAPINKDKTGGDFLTSGGQVSGFRGELTFTRSFLPGRFGNPRLPNSLEMLDKARKLCRDDEKAEFEDATCDKAYFDTVKKFLGEADRSPFEAVDAAFNNANLWNVGASASLGYDEHEYRDFATFAKSSTERTPFSVTAFVGQVGPAANFGFGNQEAVVSWRLGGEYKQDFEAPTERTLCRAVPSSPNQECFTGAFAKPEKTRAKDLYSVIRWVPTPDGQLFGLKGFEAKAAYDFEHEVFGIGASVYLVADEKGRARAGVRANWQSNDDDPATKDDNFKIGIFLGLPLGF